MIYDLALDLIDKYKEEGKKNITLEKMTYLDIELKYEGQEIEDLSFDSEGYLWFMDNQRNLYKSEFNPNEYGLNKNPDAKSIKHIDTNNIFETFAQLIENKIDDAQNFLQEHFNEEETELKDEKEEKNEKNEKIQQDTENKGKTINLPKGLGKVKTFEAWDYPEGIIGSEWNHTSNQYKFWLEADGLHSFDSDGFGVVNNSYVVAVTSTFGNPGDFLTVKLEDGTIIPCIIGDIKSQGDKGCNEYGHLEGQCVLEFMGKTSMWYNKGFGDPTKVYKPEWYNKAVDSITNTGVSYFNNPEYINLYEEKEDTKKTEKTEKSTFEEFERSFWTNKTIAIFDSEGTRNEWKKAINANEENGTELYAQNGSKPIDWYKKFKDDKDFLKGKEHILVEVGPNDLNDWNSMENLLDLLVERRDKGAKIYFEQIESTSGCKVQSVIDAFNQHLKEYQDTHENCYYIETRAYPNNLLDENGDVKYCDPEGLHFLEGVDLNGKNAYDAWAENTAYAAYKINQREYSSEEIEIMGYTVDEDDGFLYEAIDFVDDFIK